MKRLTSTLNVQSCSEFQVMPQVSSQITYFTQPVGSQWFVLPFYIYINNCMNSVLLYITDKSLSEFRLRTFLI